MHVMFLIFVDVGLYNVNRRSICALKHPDVPFTSFRKYLLVRWSVFVLRNVIKFCSICIYEWEVSVDESGILPSVFIVHHASGIRRVGNPFLLYVKYVGRWSLLFAHCF